MTAGIRVISILRWKGIAIFLYGWDIPISEKIWDYESPFRHNRLVGSAVIQIDGYTTGGSSFGFWRFLSIYITSVDKCTFLSWLLIRANCIDARNPKPWRPDRRKSITSVGRKPAGRIVRILLQRRILPIFLAPRGIDIPLNLGAFRPLLVELSIREELQIYMRRARRATLLIGE